MVRLIVRIDDAGMAANVGGSVLTLHRTIDVSLPELETILRSSRSTYSHAQLVGCEIVEADE